MGDGGEEGVSHMNRFLLYWLPLVIWILGIFVVSFLPSDSYPSETALPGISADYLLHVTAFFVLFLLWYRMFHTHEKEASVTRKLLLSLGLTVTVAVGKECLQIVAPSRTFSISDMLLDGAAALTAMGCVWIWLSGRISYAKKQEIP